MSNSNTDDGHASQSDDVVLPASASSAPHDGDQPTEEIVAVTVEELDNPAVDIPELERTDSLVESLDDIIARMTEFGFDEMIMARVVSAVEGGTIHVEHEHTD